MPHDEGNCTVNYQTTCITSLKKEIVDILESDKKCQDNIAELEKLKDKFHKENSSK